MRMEPPVAPSWRKIVTPYRAVLDDSRFGFVIEAVGHIPENPRLWVEGTTGVMSHSPGCFIVLPGLPADVIAEIARADTVVIEERYRRRHAETYVPWGLDRIGGTGQTYTVTVIHTEGIGDIRKIFNELPDDGPEPAPAADPPWRMSTD